MYDPDDNEVIVNEIFYNAASEQKLGSKMGVFSADKLPTSILKSSRKRKYVLYGKYGSRRTNHSRNTMSFRPKSKPEKLYFEMQYMV